MSKSNAAIYVTKIAAASRQLDAAIRMFFIQEDELAIHTVAAAAFQVLRDVSKNQGGDFTQEVLKNGIYNLAVRYAEGRMDENEKRMIENSGLKTIMEGLLPDIRSQGAAFDRGRISVGAGFKADQRAWPSKAANFLKHADRDVDDHLPIEEVKNEHMLMGASTAYLHLMETPTPEIMGYFSFWAAKNNAVGDVGDEIRDFTRRLAAMPEAERYSACSRFIGDQKKAP